MGKPEEIPVGAVEVGNAGQRTSETPRSLFTSTASTVPWRDPKEIRYVIRHVPQIFARVLHARLLTTVMYALRILPRFAFVRSFHSPFVALNATNHLAAPPPSTTYEKQHDPSPEPHLSSSGTRTYVVSEPDPSNTPYEVPSGAYPASASYLTTAPIPEGSHSSTSSSLLHPSNTHAMLHQEAGIGQSAGVRNTAAPGGTGRAVGGIGLMDAPGTKPGKF